MPEPDHGFETSRLSMMGLMSKPSRVSRRAFIGMTAGAAAVPAVTAGCQPAGAGSAAKPGAPPARAGRGPVRENARAGNPDWDVRHTGGPDAIMGYAGQYSVLPGEKITLYVSTTSPSFTIKAFRMGWYNGDLARLVWKSGTVPGHRQPKPKLIKPANTVQTRWHPTTTVPTDDWPEGSYLLRLDSEAGPQRFVPVTVRSARTAGKTVIKNGVATWQAYNTWGGYDLYNGPGGITDYNNRSLAVSLDRPYDQMGAYMFLFHERKLITLAERLGMPLAYTTSMDIEHDPHLLDGASALFSLGHDEYWSPPERANVTAARNAGVNLAFLGANCCFRRTRLAATPLGDRRLVICYKTSYLEDPMYGKDNKLVTSDWREPPYPDPESSMTGTLYESNPTSADYVVASPKSWLFAGTGVVKGTRFRGLVGIEYDRVNPDSPVERPIEILSHSPLTCRGVNSYADSAYYTHASGAGVFNSGTMRWVASFGGWYRYGLNRHTARFTLKVTRNVLRAFADGPAADKYPAHDNLAAMDEWAGDPIASQHNLWPPIHL
jgi:N,N-dimethylformamidase beta subunit-like protein